MITVFVLIGCAGKPKSVFDVNPGWTEKPTKVTVLFVDSVVENKDDLKDDLEEYSESFGNWFGAEVKKDIEQVSRNAVLIDVKKVETVEIGFDADSLNGVAVKVPKASSMEGSDGVYLVLGNVIFSRNEKTYENYAYTQSGAAFGQPVDPGKNSMAAAGSSFTESALWIHADYAFYNSITKERLGFGHWELKSKFVYAMTRNDWEKCVLALSKKMLARTPILNK